MDADIITFLIMFFYTHRKLNLNKKKRKPLTVRALKKCGERALLFPTAIILS